MRDAATGAVVAPGLLPCLHRGADKVQQGQLASVVVQFKAIDLIEGFPVFDSGHLAG